MGEGQGRAQCPLVLAFLACPAPRELTWETESPLPALVSRSLLGWQVVKPEDRRGTERDLVQGVSATPPPPSLRAQGFGCLWSQAQP